MKQVDITEIAIEATTGAPVVVLREQDSPHRLLPIFIGAPEAASIASTVTGQSPSRPLTHDLMATLLDTLGARLETVEVTDLTEGSFTARLTVRNVDGTHELDSRPSDAIALALRAGVPVLVSDEVMDEAAALPETDETDDTDTATPLDGDGIDDTVADFREFLDRIAPSDFDAEQED